jgi:hypothetical protein
MTTILRLSTGVSLALLVTIPRVEAQDWRDDTRAMPVTTIDVEQLVEGGQPIDHLRLRDHFFALSERYRVEAARVLATARSFAFHARVLPGNPAVHRAARSGVAGESAAITARLATHHARLALGLPSRLPIGAGPFERGAGAPEPGASRLRQLSARARTGAEHRLLAEYLSESAMKYTVRARDYTALALAYRNTANRRTASGDPAIHCDREARRAREAAINAAGLAHEHAKLASVSMR